jgi:hypothetical protein
VLSVIRPEGVWTFPIRDPKWPRKHSPEFTWAETKSRVQPINLGGINPSGADRWKEMIFYAVISLIGFLIGFGILGVMLWKADLLVRLGLTGNLYYIVLLPLALASAAFLFGVMQAYAHYKGKQFGGVLGLSGPIVGAALVVIGGFILVPNQTPFDFTVFVHGENVRDDLLLKNSGQVVLDLNNQRRKEKIGDNGEAYFAGVAANFRGQEVPIWVESEVAESVTKDQKARLDGAPIYLAVRLKAGHIAGRVRDENGNPLEGAKIGVAGLSTTTDSAGHLDFVIPGDRLKPELDLDTVASGYSSSHLKVVPNGNDVVIPLTPAR